MKSVQQLFEARHLPSSLEKDNDESHEECVHLYHAPDKMKAKKETEKAKATNDDHTDTSQEGKEADGKGTVTGHLSHLLELGLGKVLGALGGLEGILSRHGRSEWSVLGWHCQCFGCLPFVGCYLHL